MFYFLLELQATGKIYDEQGKSITVPALLTSQFPTGEVIPVFLSRFQAYLYMKSNKLDNEFQLVTADSLAISPYRDIVHVYKDKAPWQCMMVLGIQPEEKRFDIRLWNKTFTLYEAFFTEKTIRQEIESLLGHEYYQVLVENETWSDDKVVQEANKLLNDTFPEPSSNVISGLGHKLKTLFSNKKTEEVSTFLPEEKDLFDVGYGHLFILKAPDVTFCAHTKGNKSQIFLFANKLDAVIYALIEKEKNGVDYEAVKFEKHLSNLLKFVYESGGCSFVVVYGFMGTRTPFGAKWAKENESSPLPLMFAVEYPWEEIESGFNLNDYFGYVLENKEREESLTSLVKTNHTSANHLMNVAKKYLADMRVNTITVSKDTPTYHKMLFVGS